MEALSAEGLWNFGGRTDSPIGAVSSCGFWAATSPLSHPMTGFILVSFRDVCKSLIRLQSSYSFSEMYFLIVINQGKEGGKIDLCQYTH